ncbi:MAG: hypothetical protein DCC57_13790 [Chloroflexi bacterium]|nr:MAG: hypothetical protein DCC57_13790 [Chloroflexota bacterium]
MKSRYLWIALWAAVAVLLLGACQAVQTPGSSGEAAAEAVPCNRAEITETGGAPSLNGCVLRVAVENAYQPFNYIDPDSGEAVGYDYDIFAEVCTRIDCQVEYIETSWDAMVAVMGGEGSFDTFDVGADGITITEERAQHVDFSIPYITSQQLLLVRIDEDRFTQPAEFAADPNLIVGTQLGTTNYDAAVELVGEDRVRAYDQFGPGQQRQGKAHRRPDRRRGARLYLWQGQPAAGAGQLGAAADDGRRQARRALSEVVYHRTAITARQRIQRRMF